MKIKNEFFFNKIPFYLTFLLPAFLVSGPFLADSAITVCAIIFLINSYKNNLWSYYRNYFFYFFFFFYICINLSSLFSSNVIFSLKTSLPYLRFVIFALSTWYILNTNSKKLIKYFLYSFLIVFMILGIDGLYQYVNKYNLFGYPLLHNRVSSLFGDELVLGSFVSRNFPLFLGLFYLHSKNYNLSSIIKIFFFIIIIFIPFLIFLSGERTSLFFTVLSGVYILLFVWDKKLQIAYIVSVLIIIFGIFFLESRFSDRIIKTTKEQLTYSQSESKKINIFSKTHEEHYLSAFKIFKDNVILGAGPKSFRLKCVEEKYLISEFSCVSHPHNTYFQLLSETGLVGFFLIFSLFVLLCLSSLIMIYHKYFLKKKTESFKIYLFASFLITLWPTIPSGNFFTNWLNIIYYLPVGFFLWFHYEKT
jgi:O-antigen ligase